MLGLSFLLSLLSVVVCQDLFLTNSLDTNWPLLSKGRRPARPNIVWFLTDDQDQQLGGSFPLTSEATPMPKTKKLLQDHGVHATNWYIHTPICSPSRSELLTGRYFHNLKRIGGEGYCAGMHVNYSIVNRNSFGQILKEEAGYATGLFGKYVNEMPAAPPSGWDAWLANGGGNYIAPSFQTKGIDGLPDGMVHFTNAPENYTTALVGNYSISWIKRVAKQGKPFLAYIAPKAAHEPFNPAPWYRDHWDPSWPDHEPRSKNWNCSFESRRKHHGNIATEPMITAEASKQITGIFKNRWRTLMSVDDVIAEVVTTIEDLGLLDSTYFFYSSDHGFQLGQFNVPMDKRHVYEWDTKIHLLARGPGIAAGSSFSAPGTQVDIAPTLLGLAGVRSPTRFGMDGRSIVPFLIDERNDVLESTRWHLDELGSLETYKSSWRKEVFIEYYYCDYNIKCTTNCSPGAYPKSDANCANLVDNTDCWCTRGINRKTDPTCYTTEDLSNNFIALRQLDGRINFEGQDMLYAEFQTGDLATAKIDFDHVDFVEYYDIAKDPWQLDNLAPSTKTTVEHLHKRLRHWLQCSGSECP